MENKIPTAEEFLKDKLSEIHEEEIFEDLLQRMFTLDVSEVMVAFAKMHVEAALKEASENAELKYRINDISCNDKILDKKSILNAYPLTNIK